MAGGGLLTLPPAASAQSCISEKSGRNLTCTANDVRIAFADNIRDVNGNALGTCISGQTFSFIADFHLVLSASSRYDIGLWFATDGGGADGALSGTCSVSMITAQTLPNPLGSANSVNLDGDACRDITTASGWGPPNGRVVTVKVDNVLCQDTDGNGKLDLPNCTSWSQNSGGVCNVATDTVPGSPSKCSCDVAFNVPIDVDTPKGSATKTVSPASLPEPGGEFTYTIGFTNTSKFVSITLDRICDNLYGTIFDTPANPCAGKSRYHQQHDVHAAANAGGRGQLLVQLQGRLHVLDGAGVVDGYRHVLRTRLECHAQGRSKLRECDGDDHGRRAERHGHQVAGRPPVRGRAIQGERDEQQPLIDTLKLTALSDSGFGDITSVHDNVRATTCSVPVGGLSVGATPYECTFDAYFCGASHTNTITATVSDNDGSGSPTAAPSNSLTVNVGATAP